jgi:hypothetical protein
MLEDFVIAACAIGLVVACALCWYFRENVRLTYKDQRVGK